MGHSADQRQRAPIVVIGAGAAGLMAAGRAAELGAPVLLLEKTEEAGQKILVSGKERCNLTNSAPLEEFIRYYGDNGQFLRNAYYRFFREELLELLARYGVHTQVERGGRIFPTSGRAADVRDALLRYVTEGGAEIRYRAPVARLVTGQMATGADSEARAEIRAVELRSGERVPARAVILATGGASWPATGSTGDGYVLARDAGHTLVPLRPALVPLTVAERQVAKSLQGVSLRNVACSFYSSPAGKAEVEKELEMPYPLPVTGEMLFTHFGVSGPLLLTASLAVVDALRAGQQVTLSIDMKPGMTPEQVHARLQREFESYPHRHLPRLLRDWVPGSLADMLAQLSSIDRSRELHSLRATEREELVRLLKDFRWTITGSLPLAAAMVTAGGVALDEVDPATFASRVVAGLYVVGETLDLAADTGGFNLQAAFSSGYLAGEDAADRMSA